MFHKWLIISLLGTLWALAGDSAYPQDDNAFTFKPAQTNLTAIFLQFAGSLEHHGHPGPYLRHVKSENERISTKYEASKGKKMTSYLPSYMTEEYIEELSQQWDQLAPKLKLERLAKDSGKLMQLAIKGESGKGTSLIVVFNRHQDLVYKDMVASGKRTIGFKQLKEKLRTMAEGGEAQLIAQAEPGLSKEEQRAFALLIEKPKFTKADFPALERFYDGPHDRLSEYGKSLLSQKVFAGQRGQGVPGSDAVKYSAAFQSEFETLFGKLRDQLSPETASTLENWVIGVVIDTGRAACSELELGIQENALDRLQRN